MQATNNGKLDRTTHQAENGWWRAAVAVRVPGQGSALHVESVYAATSTRAEALAVEQASQWWPECRCIVTDLMREGV